MSNTRHILETIPAHHAAARELASAASTRIDQICSDGLGIVASGTQVNSHGMDVRLLVAAILSPFMGFAFWKVYEMALGRLTTETRLLGDSTIQMTINAALLITSFALIYFFIKAYASVQPVKRYALLRKSAQCASGSRAMPPQAATGNSGVELGH